MHERWNEIEEEKLKILKEKMALKKQMFECLKINNLEYKDVLISINENLIHLRDEVEKLGPSCLT